jgi:hypothetical protein
MSKISFIILISVLFASGCTTVKPWERGYLAKDVMESPQDSLRSSLDNHIYFSKEGSSGGGQAAGGGCGCN